MRLHDDGCLVDRIVLARHATQRCKKLDPSQSFTNLGVKGIFDFGRNRGGMVSDAVVEVELRSVLA